MERRHLAATRSLVVLAAAWIAGCNCGGKPPAASGPSHFVYAANESDPAFGGKGSVSQYSIGPDGALAPLSTPSLAAGTSSPYYSLHDRFVAIHPSGKHVYVASYDDSAIFQYDVNADGSLTPMSVPSAAVTPDTKNPSLVKSIAVDPSGKYAYVGNNSVVFPYLEQFTVGADGSLTQLAAAPTVPAGGDPYTIAVDPTGKYVYAANSGDGDVSAYAIGAGGALQPVSCGTGAGCSAVIQTSSGPTTTTNYLTGPSPYGIVVDPSGKYLYVVNSGASNDGNVAALAIGAGGTLTPIACGTASTPGCDPDLPANFAAGRVSVGIAVDPSGKHLYVASYGSNDLSAYAIGANGALTQIACDPSAGEKCAAGIPANFDAALSPTSVAVDPSGKYLYAGSRTSPGAISQYTIASSGALKAMAKTAPAPDYDPLNLVVR